MQFPSKEMLTELRKQYPVGTRVELVLQAPPMGTKGTVKAVDDMGTIHVAWDNGSTLGIIFGADSCRKII